LVLIAVGEDDLPVVLQNLPQEWKDRLVLLSNELLPQTWQKFDISSPTVISVQFEKKAGRPVVIDRPSPIFGPQSAVIKETLEELDIPSREVADLGTMTRELVLKNLYILTLNLAGLATGGTAAELLQQHRGLTEGLWDELFAIQQAMVETPLSPAELKQETMDYLALAPDRSAGRSARERLHRTLEHAREKGIDVPSLEKLYQETVT
jgi:hypothetical protein